MPQERPPPPYGTRTVSTSGRSSRISRPIVAVAGDDGRIARRDGRRGPSMPGIAVLHEHAATSGRRARFTMRPPSALDRLELRSPAPCPARRRCRGRRAAARSRRRPAPCCRRSPCRRRARAPRGRARAIALPAPRILNEPIGCRFSSFSQISAPRRRRAARAACGSREPARRSRRGADLVERRRPQSASWRPPPNSRKRPAPHAFAFS